jgi:cell wall hydrolase
VTALQRQLEELGYAIFSVDGHFGDDTLHAVQTFQKVAGLSRDGVVGPITRDALERASVPAPADRSNGFHIEIDLGRQVMFFVEDGRVTNIYDVSTGNGQTYTSEGSTRIAVTPPGHYKIYRKIDAWRHSLLGYLYRPAYFNGGIAIHGATSVPAYPASHGCVRVTINVMDSIYDRLAYGSPVMVHP